MGYTGFDTPFYIHRKRNLYSLQFQAYLKGLESAADEWPDAEDTDIDPQNDGDTQLAPFGYLTDGDDYLVGNLGVDGDTITAFTIGFVFSRDQTNNNDAIVYGLFGSTHYPRIYFQGETLKAEIKLDGVVKTVSVANVDTYMKKGQPHFIVFRGSTLNSIDLLIDGVQRGTLAATGTDYDVGTGDFRLLNDTDKNYFNKGNLRGFFSCASKLSDAQVVTWYNMLAYEGYLDIWRDNFAKWSGFNSWTFGTEAIASSPYVATIVES